MEILLHFLTFLEPVDSIHLHCVFFSLDIRLNFSRSLAWLKEEYIKGLHN